MVKTSPTKTVNFSIGLPDKDVQDAVQAVYNMIRESILLRHPTLKRGELEEATKAMLFLTASVVMRSWESSELLYSNTYTN